MVVVPHDGRDTMKGHAPKRMVPLEQGARTAIMFIGARSTSRPAPRARLPRATALVTSLSIYCLCGQPAFVAAQDNIRIAIDDATQRISVTAARVPRAQLLELLRTKYSIEVRPYLSPDEIVSVNFVNQPLETGIAAIMPRGSHYLVRFGERDIAGPRPNTTRAVKRGSPDSRRSTLPAKTESPMVRPRGEDFKPDPARVVETRPAQGPTVKALSDSSERIPFGKGPKSPRATNAVQDSSLSLSFTIVAPNQIRLVRAMRIEGAVPESPLVHGPFLFALRGAGGQLVYFGSLLDPLEMRSYLQDSVRHDVSRATEGFFSVTIPARLATAARLGALTLVFYDARNVTLPRELDARSFDVATRRATMLTRVAGPSLLGALREGPRE